MNSLIVSVVLSVFVFHTCISFPQPAVHCVVGHMVVSAMHALGGHLLGAYMKLIALYIMLGNKRLVNYVASASTSLTRRVHVST